MTRPPPTPTGHADARGILDTNTVVNPADFQDIDGLTVRLVPHPDAADTA